MRPFSQMNPNRLSLIFALSGILLAGAAQAEEATLPSQEKIRQQVREEAQTLERTMALTPEEREARQAERQTNRKERQANRPSGQGSAMIAEEREARHVERQTNRHGAWRMGAGQGQRGGMGGGIGHGRR